MPSFAHLQRKVNCQQISYYKVTQNHFHSQAFPNTHTCTYTHKSDLLGTTRVVKEPFLRLQMAFPIISGHQCSNLWIHVGNSVTSNLLDCAFGLILQVHTNRSFCSHFLSIYTLAASEHTAKGLSEVCGQDNLNGWVGKYATTPSRFKVLPVRTVFSRHL